MLGSLLQFDDGDRSPRESASPEVDELIDRATEAAGRATDDIAAELLKIIQGVDSAQAASAQADNFLAEQETLLAPLFQRVLLASTLAGSAAVVSRTRQGKLFDASKLLPGRSRLPPEPPRVSTLTPGGDDLPPRWRLKLPILADVEKRLEESPVLAATDYLDAAAKARAGAFVITGNIRQATVETVRDVFAENLRTGDGRREFVREVRARLGITPGDQSEEATGPLSEARLRQVFRTNVAQYFQAGQEKAASSPLVADAFPYRLQMVTHDERVRETHLAIATAGIDGTAVFHADDPVWKVLGGAWDYNCRCAGAPLTVDAAARKGVREAEEWIARAEALKAKHGGYRGQYYAETAPTEFVRVPWPTFEGKPILPSPGFRKDADAN
jgi:hypothetical protein